MPRRENETARSWWRRMPLAELRSLCDRARDEAKYEYREGRSMTASNLWGKYKAIEQTIIARAAAPSGRQGGQT